MALKKQFQSQSTFAMASMTDVIFLLLIFFMASSTLISPTAIEVDLPQASSQTSIKPVTEVYLDSLNNLYLVVDRNDSTSVNNTARPVTREQLLAELGTIQQKDSLRAVALFASEKVEYRYVVEILDMAAQNNLKMVLSARARDVNNNGQQQLQPQQQPQQEQQPE